MRGIKAYSMNTKVSHDYKKARGEITLFPYQKFYYIHTEFKRALTGAMTKSSLPIRSNTLTVPALSA